jgi:hypothetical protein
VGDPAVAVLEPGVLGSVHWPVHAEPSMVGVTDETGDGYAVTGHGR